MEKIVTGVPLPNQEPLQNAMDSGIFRHCLDDRSNFLFGYPRHFYIQEEDSGSMLSNIG